ncbi:MAG: hypothetical protein WCA08_15630 [Desulfoferrobacter sp.]
MAKSLGCLLAASVLFLASCTGTQQFVPKASVYKTSDEKAVITVERKYSRRGGMRQVTLVDSGNAVGELGNCGKLTWERPAGSMKLTLKPSFGMVKDDVPPVEESVAPGKVYRYYVVWDAKVNSFAILNE